MYFSKISPFLKPNIEGFRLARKVTGLGPPDEIKHVSIRFMDYTQDKNILNGHNALIQELRQRNKELEETNACLENFVHVIAHDMRSPVAT